MRYIRMFFLSFQNVLEYRSRAFVWFLFSILSTMMYLLFWRARSASGNPIPGGWSTSDITTYYLLFMVAGSTLMSHVEEDVSNFDIYRGGIVKFLSKPIGYFLAKLYEELPYRIMMGGFALTTFAIVPFLFPGAIVLSLSFPLFLLGILSAACAFMLSQTMKMAMALIAFWLTDAWYAFEMFEILQIIFAGMTVPLVFLSEPLRTVALLSPFASILYLPVVLFMGKLTLLQSISVICMQLVWIGFFALLYRWLFAKGIKKFMGAMD